jgi:lysyl-tRNA synthetase class 2
MNPEETSDIIRKKLADLQELKKEGFNFPNCFKPIHNSIFLRDLPESQFSSETKLKLAGRVILKRDFGKTCFFHLLDEYGKFQIYGKQDSLEHFEKFRDLNIGDIIGVEGYPFFTKTRERTVFVKRFQLLTKNIYPLPEKWHGLSDVEERFRHRYLDLISNYENREIFKTRAKIIQKIRRFLDNRGFLEVETPILTSIKAGANARPFVTRHNALGVDFYLRIALELPLKKLVVGGFERVYELGKNFRNEGIDRKHNPEFTMLEFYQAYATFEDLMDLTEELLCQIADEVFNKRHFEFEGKTFNLQRPFRRLRMEDAIYEIGGVSRDLSLRDQNDLAIVAREFRVEYVNPLDWGSCVQDLFEALVEGKLIEPTFITHHPVSVSPLARRNDFDPELTDRFELYIAGLEVANAFSELNDSEDQLERFVAQLQLKSKEGEEAQELDEDFIKALRVGMPPTAGEGIGIDRLVMLLTGKNSIREVVLFPQLRPEER